MLRLVKSDTNTRKKYAPKELTHRQETFCRNVVEGMTLVDSYVNAGYASKAPRDQIYSRAHKLRWDNDRIINRITELRAERDLKTSHCPDETRAFILAQLMVEAQNSDARPAERLKALELLGKVTSVGLFTEKHETTVENKSDSEVITQLEQRLKALAKTA